MALSRETSRSSVLVTMPSRATRLRKLMLSDTTDELDTKVAGFLSECREAIKRLVSERRPGLGPLLQLTVAVRCLNEETCVSRMMILVPCRVCIKLL